MTEQRLSHDDEISLVNFAAILVRRWKAMAIIFSTVVAVALAYALIMTPTYKYTSVYEVAEQAPVGEDNTDRELESANTVISKAESLYVAPTTREVIEQSGLEKLPFEVRLTTPENTHLVIVTSQAALDTAPLVEKMHRELLLKVENNQQALVSRQRKTLENRLESLRTSISNAEQSTSPGSADLISSYADQMATTTQRLELLKDGATAQISVKSLKQSGLSRPTILALAVILGVALSIAGVLFMHFAKIVREKLKEEELR